MKPSQAHYLKTQFELVMWSHLSRDYDPKLNIQESLNAMKKAKPGAIFVFHDSEKSFENLKILIPELLRYFHERGYRFLSLDQRK
jgi:peptidoglycan/xylan/chitin deacetylase (PgdA/CDA1 family)